jgi:HK97 family phage major capsid protein
MDDTERESLSTITELLADVQAEIDFRDSIGDKGPRASASRGRKTSPDVGDASPLGRITADGAAPALPGRSSISSHDGRFANLFGQSYGGQRSPFPSLGAFALSVASGKPDTRLMNATMTEGVGQDGGYLMPVQYLGPILDAALQVERVRPYASVIPMTSNTATAGLFDYQDGTNAARGGLRMLWGAEAAAMSEQKGKLRDITLKASKAYIFCRVSRELAEDAVAFDRQLNAAMIAAVAAGLDAAFVNGTGVAQPLGAVGAGCAVTVTKESGPAASTLLLQNLAKMVGRLHPSSFARSRWMIHPTVVPTLYLMSFTVKNVAGTENVGGSFVQAITQDADGTLRIFGRPCDVSDACAPLGTVGDVVLADWSRYVIGLRRDATLDRDTSRYFDSDEVAFKLTLRLDGQPGDTSPTKLRDGSNTVSPFVVLETR